MNLANIARFVAILLCPVALGAAASEDPHAAPAKTEAVAMPAAATTPKPVKEAVAPVEAKPAMKDGKPVPTASPQEVAARIAEKLAILRAAKAEQALREATRPRVTNAPKPVPTAARPAETATGMTTEPKHVHWSYGGDNGPLHWADMNPEWAKCGSGNRQSPIDIRSGIKVDLEPINFDYKPTGFSVIDNGHTIQVNLGAGNHITVGGRMFELVQFHFHRPSEERINGRTYDMVAHLVHKDANGKLAVVAVLIQPGAARKLIQTVWNNLPLEKNETVSPPGSMDMNDILPTQREYYTYMGSLTTPPCSEGVLWMVMKEPLSVSQEQIDLFARLYQMNARPIQASADRMIKESN